MKCETCDQLFPDSSVKVWNGKRVCPSCFQTLANSLPTAPGSNFPLAALPIDPAAYIDVFASGPGRLVRWRKFRSSCSCTDGGRLRQAQISAAEARQWGAFLIINIKARIAKIPGRGCGYADHRCRGNYDRKQLFVWCAFSLWSSNGRRATHLCAVDGRGAGSPRK